MSGRHLMAAEDEPIVFDQEWIENVFELAVLARSNRRPTIPIAASNREQEERRKLEQKFREFLCNGIVKVPLGFSSPLFLERVLDAVRAFAEEPTRQRVRWDINKLRRLANAPIEAEGHAVKKRRNDTSDVDVAYEQLAKFLETPAREGICCSAAGSTASAEARDYLNRYSTLPCRAPILPSPGTLRDPARRGQACIDVWTLCTTGVDPVDPAAPSPWLTGLRYRLNAPPLKRMDRHPERMLVFSIDMALRSAWPLGRIEPGWTAHQEKRNPFVQFAQRVLILVGAPGASAVSLLNGLHEVRKEAPSWKFHVRTEEIKRRIERAFKRRGTKTQTEISRLDSHAPKELLAAALSDLKDQGLLTLTTVKTRGRPRKVWRYTKPVAGHKRPRKQQAGEATMGTTRPKLP